MPAADSSPDDAPQFRSPKRALARAFRLSRDRWKDKANQRRQEIKALKIRLRDVEASRELWKQKALHLQAQLQELRGQFPSGPPDQPDTASTTPAVLPSPTAPNSAAASAPQLIIADDPDPLTSRPTAAQSAQIQPAPAPRPVTENPAPKKAPRARR